MARRSTRIERLSPMDWAVIAAAAVIGAVAHVVYGAAADAWAAGLTAAEGVLLAAILAAPRLRDDLAARAGGLSAPALLFSAVLILALRSAIPGAGAPVGLSPAVMEVVKMVGLACVFLVGVAVGGRDERAKRFLMVTAWLTGAFAVLALYQFKAAPDMLGLGRKTLFLDRLSATFVSPNTAAALFGIGAVLAMTAALETGSKTAKAAPAAQAAVSWAAMGACLTAVVLTGSGGGLLATLVGLGALLIAHAVANRDRLKAARAALAAAACLVGAGVLVGAELLLAGAETSQGVDRGAIFAAHWRAFLQHPLLGWGLGGFDTVNKSLLTPQAFPALWTVRAAHNVYLQWLEETGVVGAVLMFGTVAAILALTALGFTARRSMHGWLRGLLAVALLVLVHGVSDYALQTPSIASLWAVLLGVGVGVATGQRTPRTRSAEAPRESLASILKTG